MNDAQQRDGEFDVSVASRDGVHTATLSGELDIATAGRLTEALEALEPAPGEQLVIDLASVGFMDSTGLRVLIAANRDAADTGYELVIVTGESPARRVLELTRMDEHMRVLPAIS